MMQDQKSPGFGAGLLGASANPLFQAGMGFLSSAYDRNVNPWQTVMQNLTAAREQANTSEDRMRQQQLREQLAEHIRNMQHMRNQGMGMGMGMGMGPGQGMGMGPARGMQPGMHGMMGTGMMNPQMSQMPQPGNPYDPLNALQGAPGMMGGQNMAGGQSQMSNRMMQLPERDQKFMRDRAWSMMLNR